MDNSQILTVALSASLLGNVALFCAARRWRNTTLLPVTVDSAVVDLIKVRNQQVILICDLDDKISHLRHELGEAKLATNYAKAALNDLKAQTKGAILRDPKTGRMTKVSL